MKPIRSQLLRDRRARWIATSILVLLLFADLARENRFLIGAAFQRPLPCIDTDVSRTSLSYHYSFPSTTTPSLLRIGPAPTPISLTYSAENEQSVCIFLYECLGNLRFLDLDKNSMTFREYSIPGSKLTYGVICDQRDENVIWISTCLTAAIYRYDRRAQTLRQVFEAPTTESHIFGFDQHADGSLIVGTFPNARCFRVDVCKPVPSIEELQVDLPPIQNCKYLHGVFCAADELILHYASPGTLLKYNLKSRESTVLLRSSQAFLTFDVSPECLTAGDGQKTWHIDREGSRMDRPIPNVRRPEFTIHHEGGIGHIECNGRTAEFSLFPRDRGMRITAFNAGANGRIYGGTYWNTWAFELTPRRREVRGLGPLPQGSGEFFTSTWWKGRLAIPNYQGKLYLVDCSSEFTDDNNRPNPQILACVPRAHYGLACATTTDNRLIYSTYPNYDQIGGMLVMCVQDQPPLVWDNIADGLTLGSLAAIDGVIFGGTTRAHGLGLKLTPSRQRMPQIVALSINQKKIFDILTLESNSGDVKGLITLSDKQLLCATEKRLFLVNMDSSQLHAVETSNFHRFKQIYGCRIRRIARYRPRHFLILTDQFLFVFVQDTGKVAPLCRLPRQIKHLVADDDGNVFFASSDSIYCLAVKSMRKLFEATGIPFCDIRPVPYSAIERH